MLWIYRIRELGVDTKPNAISRERGYVYMFLYIKTEQIGLMLYIDYTFYMVHYQ